MPIKHVIEPGESTISLADRYGFFPETVWNFPDNAKLRQLREDMNTLMPGDVLVIPDKKEKNVAVPTGKVHRFRRKGVPARFRLQVFDVETPRAKQAYTLIVDGVEYKGVTDDKGMVDQHIPAQAKEGELIIGADEFRLRIQFGHLDPINEIVGVQKRLNNLGYDCGEPDGQLNDKTKAALKEFQLRFGLPASGEPDAATTDKLREVHDKPFVFDKQGQQGK